MSDEAEKRLLDELDKVLSEWKKQGILEQKLTQYGLLFDSETSDDNDDTPS